MLHFIRRHIAFGPPDDLGGGTTVETPAETTLVSGADDASTVTETPVADDKPRVESVGESVRRALRESKQKAITPKGTNSPQAAGATTGDVTAKTDSTTKVESNTGTAAQGATGAPQSWKAEEKAIWDSLPEIAKSAVTRREADTAKGVQELRSRYQDIEAAIAPYSNLIKQNNATPAQAIAHLFRWNTELAGPNKVIAARSLLQSFGIDPATLATAPVQGAQQGATQTIPDNLRPIIEGLESRLRGFETNAATQAQLTAQQTWKNWSQNKPHAESVRGLMANLVNSDLSLLQAGQPQVSNTINPETMSIDMDAAYQAAIYAHPEVRQLVLQEEQKKRDAEARAAADKARRAGGSLRSGAPAGPLANGHDRSARVESPRESIQRALSELRGA